MGSFESYFAALQKACNPAIWSKGIALARDLRILEDKIAPDELVFKIVIPNRPVSPRVTLWPDDEDWHCNCGDKTDPCSHIAAAAIAFKAGNTQKPGGTAESKTSSAAVVQYRFIRKGGALQFERWLCGPGSKQEKLKQTLVSYVGGLTSGRITAAPVASTREDFLVDGILNDQRGSDLPVHLIPALLKALTSIANITLDGQPVSIGGGISGAVLKITDDPRGFRLKLMELREVDEVFENGIARMGSTLLARTPNRLTTEEKREFSGEGLLLEHRHASRFVAEILPALEQKIPLQTETDRLPERVTTEPRIILETTSLGGNRVSILPVIIYGDPPIARLDGQNLTYLSETQVPRRDPGMEKLLARKLQSELHLSPGQPLLQITEAAIRFINAARAWDFSGRDLDSLMPKDAVTPRARILESGIEISFNAGTSEAEPEKVFAAWRLGASHVQLLDGSWARLPSDWLARHGQRVESLLKARTAQGKIPGFHRPELARISEDMGLECPPTLIALRRALETFSGIPEALLPANLRAELRPYQKVGFDWLEFLRSNEMGALLADDMGLGKTLQVLCTFRPHERILVVVPRSVLGSWADQLQCFRPDLKFGIYHGNDREFPSGPGVVLTTYSILRIESELLAGETWATVVLDEAQTIRNPESQVSRAAHRLNANFRVALSGTPIENRLQDLWSQFQFLNPGLLGSLQEFTQTSGPEFLRVKIRPFILRRLKKDVAAELPERIETVLTCTLSEDERATYDAVLAATREDLLKRLAPDGTLKGGAFGILEALLRLRQACCHSALLPGLKNAKSSSKLELFLETLETSLAEDHRSLVFSQWTSLLDLIEPHLQHRNIRFLRIDGNTRNREEVVRNFQTTDGPPVLLMSLKAGGVGLTLTAADHVFLLDPWWNPATENQAADRAHRIGQTRSVIIHRLVAENTIEEKVLELQKSKSQLARSVLEGDASSGPLTRDDLLALLT